MADVSVKLTITGDGTVVVKAVQQVGAETDKMAGKGRAAGVPMSGMTELAEIGPIRDVPPWVLHGSEDNDTDVETGYNGAMVGSRAVVRALREMGGSPRYTEYPREKHVIRARAFDQPKLLPWILGQRLLGKPCGFSRLLQLDRACRD